MIKVAAFGHSHLTGLQEAYESRKEGGAVSFELESMQFFKPGRPHIIDIGRGYQYHPELSAELREVIESKNPDYLVFMLQGEQSIHHGIAAEGEGFIFYLPHEQILSELNGVNTTPYNLIFQYYKTQYRIMDEFLKEHSSLFLHRSLAFSPPPPSPNPSLAIEHLKRDPNYVPLEDTSNERPFWRARVWQASVAALKAIYEEHNIIFLEAPRETIREDGYLAEQYCKDGFHATREYYLLQIQKLEQLILG